MIFGWLSNPKQKIFFGLPSQLAKSKKKRDRNGRNETTWTHFWPSVTRRSSTSPETTELAGDEEKQREEDSHLGKEDKRKWEINIKRSIARKTPEKSKLYLLSAAPHRCPPPSSPENEDSEEVEEERRRVRDSRREERVGPRRWTSAATPPEFEEQWRRRERTKMVRGGGGRRVKGMRKEEVRVLFMYLYIYLEKIPF